MAYLLSIQAMMKKLIVFLIIIVLFETSLMSQDKQQIDIDNELVFETDLEYSHLANDGFKIDYHDLTMPFDYESYEQWAQRMNCQAHKNMMESVGLSFKGAKTFTHFSIHLPTNFSHYLNISLYHDRFPAGCVPVMNSSFPFIYAKVPGCAPVENKYSPDKFPQCVKAEYDSITGTYKQSIVNRDYSNRQLSELNN